MKSKQPSKFTIPVKLWDITESVQQAERACTIVQDGAEMLKATEQTSKLQQKQATTKTSFCHSTPPLFLSQKRNNFSFLMCNLRHKHDHLIKSNKKTSKQTKNTTQKKKKKRRGRKKAQSFPASLLVTWSPHHVSAFFHTIQTNTVTMNVYHNSYWQNLWLHSNYFNLHFFEARDVLN